MRNFLTRKAQPQLKNLITLFFYKGQTIIGNAPTIHKLTKIVGIGGNAINCNFGGIKNLKYFEVYLGKIDPQAKISITKSY